MVYGESFDIDNDDRSNQGIYGTTQVYQNEDAVENDGFLTTQTLYGIDFDAASNQLIIQLYIGISILFLCFMVCCFILWCYEQGNKKDTAQTAQNTSSSEREILNIYK